MNSAVNITDNTMELRSKRSMELSRDLPLTHFRQSISNLDASKIIDNFGRFGLYQMLIYSMANVGYFIFACETMIMSLVAAKLEPNQDFYCELGPNALKNNFTIKDNCTILDSNNNEFECGQKSDSRIIFNQTDGYISIPSEFGLVCSRELSTQHGSSIFMLGVATSMPIIIQLADLYGRKLAFIIPLWLTILCNVACAFAPSYIWFLVFRFLAGFMTSAIGTVGFVMGIEAVSTSFRSISPLVSTIVWMSGYLAVGALHIYIKNWRMLFLAISAPGVLTFSYYWLMPESLHWSISNKNSKQVHRYIKKSTRINKKVLCLHQCVVEVVEKDPDYDEISSQNVVVKNTVPSRTFIDMFRHPQLVFHLILHCYIT